MSRRRVIWRRPIPRGLTDAIRQVVLPEAWRTPLSPGQMPQVEEIRGWITHEPDCVRVSCDEFPDHVLVIAINVAVALLAEARRLYGEEPLDVLLVRMARREAKGTHG